MDLKNEGNDAVKKQDFSRACEFYLQSLAKLTSNVEKAKVFSNLSMCYLRLNMYPQSLEMANKAIQSNHEWNKGYFRKIQVLKKMSPKNNDEIVRVIGSCEKNVKKFSKRENELLCDEMKSVKYYTRPEVIQNLSAYGKLKFTKKHNSKVFVIDSLGRGHFDTIQEAISRKLVGETMTNVFESFIIMSGEYFERLVVIKKNVELVGEGNVTYRKHRNIVLPDIPGGGFLIAIREGLRTLFSNIKFVNENFKPSSHNFESLSGIRQFQDIFRADQCEYFRFENCSFENPLGTCLTIIQCEDFKIVKCSFRNSFGAVTATECGMGTIKNCRIEGITTTAILICEKSKNITLDELTIENVVGDSIRFYDSEGVVKNCKSYLTGGNAGSIVSLNSAVCINIRRRSRVVVKNCILSKRHPKIVTGGGGIEVTNSSAVIKKCNVSHLAIGIGLNMGAKTTLQENLIQCNRIGIFVRSNHQAEVVLNGNKFMNQLESDWMKTKADADPDLRNQSKFSSQVISVQLMKEHLKHVRSKQSIEQKKWRKQYRSSDVSDDLNQPVVCWCCAKMEPKDERFKKCSACKKAYYCSLECQKIDWKNHKKNTCVKAIFFEN